MQNSDQSKNETFCTIIEPDETAAADFDAWQQEQKAELEASGLVVTKIEGAKFYGHQRSAATNGKS